MVAERNIQQIMILDQGIIQFNAKPKDGIAFLVKNKVISDDPLDIAKFLATTDKLDKHVLGNFLGKDNDFSIAILNMFASLFHYEGVPFDLALRAFTNRFAMPGESQMIYRVLERFSVYYSSVNGHFDKDKALILSYALIMLNVDLHSARVKVRMTKDEFVRNTQPAVGGALGRVELEEMYMRISLKELKPDTSAEEIVYSKLAVNPKYTTKQNLDGPNAQAASETILSILKKGAFLLKFGREGTPHPRKVFLSSDGKRICWIDPKRLEKMQKKFDKNQRLQVLNHSGGVECHSCLSQPKMPRFVRPANVETAQMVDHKEETVQTVDHKVETAQTVGMETAQTVDAKTSEDPHKVERQSSVNLVKIPPNQHQLEVVPPALDILRSTFIKLRSRKPVAADSFLREIPLEDVTGLVVGSGGTGNLRRFFSHQVDVDAETEQRCFSIITDYRTLDLQAPSNVDIGPWLHFFHAVLSDRETRLRAASDKNKDIWSFTQKERASLVRWQEIVPEWSAHWNCGARVSAGGGYRANQHPKEELLNHRMFLVNPSGFVLDRGQRLETAISPQLVALWLEGIPSSVRPRIWPIATGNMLRIDDKFFTTLLLDQDAPILSLDEAVFGSPGGGLLNQSLANTVSTGARELERELKSSSMKKLCLRALSWIDARGSREQQAFFKPQFRSSTLKKSFSLDLKKISPDQDEESSSESSAVEDSSLVGPGPMNNVVAAARVLVSAFLIHRKDLKYTQGMAQLAAMVIFNVGIQDLHRTYSVYANLLHQHYFIDFFTMKWRDMRMRFDLFAKLMRERMPYLEDHFAAIQITSDLYLNQWMLTGFTRVLPFRTACRVWDGFLLLGESYFFTSALALLNYYEHALMTSGFSGCLEILLGHADEVLFNDKKFFECVHYQSVSNERFAAWISAQRLAEEKTALYDLLLLM